MTFVLIYILKHYINDLVCHLFLPFNFVIKYSKIKLNGHRKNTDI